MHELEALARRAFAAADRCVSDDELELEYAALRAELESQNQRLGWASDEVLATQVPSLAARATINELERELNATEAALEVGSELGLRRMLCELGGWSFGAALAMRITYDWHKADRSRR